MDKNVVNWFEIPVNDLDRAKAFYKEVLGYEAQDMPSPAGNMEMAAFPWAQGGENTTGALVKGENLQPHSLGTRVYFTCADCGETAAKAPANGGEIAMPKVRIGEFGFIAHILDSEGNKIGLHSVQ